MATQDEIYDAFQALAQASKKLEELALASTMSGEDGRHLQANLLRAAHFLLERVVAEDSPERGTFAAVLETIRRRTLPPARKVRRR